MIRKNIIICAVLCLISILGYAQNAGTVEGKLKETVNYLTNPQRKGRAAGSQGEKDVAEYIYKQLEQYGVTLVVPKEGEDFYITQKDTIHSRNIIGIVPGYDKNLRNEYILIGAHMDHLGSSILKKDGEDVEQIFCGADDNASGVATLLEVARQVAAQQILFKRSVIFAFFGAEELGMVGSWYFLNRSFKEVENIVAMINLDMVGRSSGENKLQAFTADGNVEVTSIIKGLSNRALSISPVFVPTDFPSDHRLFYEKGIPVVLFTSGMHRDYHTVRDTPNKLDYNQMERLAEFVYSMAEHISNMDERIKKPVRTEVEEQGANKGEIIYSQNDVDKRATFLHGNEIQFLNKWVYPYIKYPDSAIYEGLEGRVIAEFVVDKNGKVQKVFIVKGLSEEIDQEVEKVIMASPKWKAATYKGNNVAVKISVPIEFKLAKTSKFKVKK